MTVEVKDSDYYDNMYVARHNPQNPKGKLPYWENHYSTKVMRERCQSGRWADLGCGAGQKNWWITKVNAIELLGVDYSSVALNFARALPPHEGPGKMSWLLHDLTDLPFPLETGSFDGCVISHTLEHIEDPHRLLSEVVRITKPSGCLIVIVPHLHHHDDSSHYWHFTPDQLKQLLSWYGEVGYLELSDPKDQITAVVTLP